MILKDFYNNGIYPIEEISPKDPEYRELGRKINTEHEYFESILSPENTERLENFYELVMNRSTIDCRESFIFGFRLAALLMIEVFHVHEK